MKLLFAIPLFLAFFSSVVADIGQETSIANEGPEASGKIRASHQKPHAATLFLPEEELLDMDPTDVDFWEEVMGAVRRADFKSELYRTITLNCRTAFFASCLSPTSQKRLPKGF